MQKQDFKSTTDLPFSPAAERNKVAIFEALQKILNGTETVLEIGSGTGQHCIHFAKSMPDIIWQPSDLPVRLAVTDAVLATAHFSNIKKAIALDANQKHWPALVVDAIYTANTAHIMSWEATQNMIVGSANLLTSEGLLIIYGPFKYEGEFTSESNKLFDFSLKRTNRLQGIRDFEGIERIANKHDLYLEEDIPMPANNRLLVFKKA